MKVIGIGCYNKESWLDLEIPNVVIVVYLEQVLRFYGDSLGNLTNVRNTCAVKFISMFFLI